MSSSNCCFLTCMQVSQEAGKRILYSHLLNFPQFIVIHTVKGFCIVNEADFLFLEFTCFFYDPAAVGNLISGCSDFSKSSLYIWKFLVHILLKPSLNDFEYYFASMWNECSCMVVWTFFAIVVLWDWNENWPFAVYMYLFFFKFFHYLVCNIILNSVFCAVRGCVEVALVASGSLRPYGR